MEGVYRRKWNSGESTTGLDVISEASWKSCVVSLASSIATKQKRKAMDDTNTMNITWAQKRSSCRIEGQH